MLIICKHEKGLSELNHTGVLVYLSALIYHVFIKTVYWNACKYPLSKQLNGWNVYILGSN